MRPLALELASLTADELICGLSQLCEALAFLHDRCGLAHNRIELDAICVSTHDHHWKLACLQHANGASPPVHQRDMPALGALFRRLLGDRGVELPAFIRLLESETAGDRPRAASLLDEPLFRHCDYLRIVHFIEHFASFDEPAIATFFETIVARLRSLPPDVLSLKLVPLLLTSRFVMLHPAAAGSLLPFLFSGSPAGQVEEPLLDEHLFRLRILPLICKLYCVRKVQIRLILLEQLPLYVGLVEQKQLIEQLLPQIWEGTRDENERLVAASFRAIALLVDRFGAAPLLGERQRLFSNIIPKALPTYAVDADEPMHASMDTSELFMQRSEPDGVECDPTKLVDSPLSESTPAALNGGGDSNGLGGSAAPVSPEPTDQREPPAKVPPSSKLILVAKTNGVRRASVPDCRGGGRPAEKSANGLDVKAVEIKPKPDEIDLLFDDMKPKFNFRPMQPLPRTPITAANFPSSKFSVQADQSTEEAGWPSDDSESDDQT